MFSGLPGVGKSEIARGLAARLHAAVVSVDPIEDAIVRSGIEMSFETGLAAYNVGAAMATMQLRNGLIVIVDAANYLEVGREVWRAVAADVGVSVRAIEVICSDVEEHRRRLESRSRGLQAYPEPTWGAVVRRKEETERWSEERLVLDAIRPVEDNLSCATDYLRC